MLNRRHNGYGIIFSTKWMSNILNVYVKHCVHGSNNIQNTI